MTEPPPAAEPSVVLHSSWSGIVLSGLGAAALAALTVVLAVGGAGPVVVACAALLAVGAAAVILFDLPVAAEITPWGVTRRAVLRHHRLAWDGVLRLERHRSGIAGTRLDRPVGGLVAVVGRRRYTLVDQMESSVEHDRVLRILGPRAERLGADRLARPPEGRSPTWMYRRSRWRPEVS